MLKVGAAQVVGLALVTTVAFGLPASAEKWPGTSPVVGGAIAAKAVGKVCPGVLQPDDMTVLQTYIDRYLDTIGERDPGTREHFSTKLLPEMEKSYTEQHAKPGGCGTGAVELAQDMVQRVRAAAGDTAYWDRVRNPRVGAIDAVYAKAVGQACAGALTGPEVERLDAFVAREMGEFAKTSSEADTSATWAYLRDSEKKFADELHSRQQCTEMVRKDARDIVGKVTALAPAK
ncbi:MAG: hypothetical protein KDJ47_01110 [Hyphomicrobiaceae bacterium]|nr:hypothetical protein [Hyphomicrobiaceae bacterium]